MSAQVPSKAEEGQRGFDDVLGALKQIVDKLESGQLSLEAALAAFEEGVRLARQGTQILDSAERRVEILTRAPGAEDPGPPGSPGSDDVRPFDPLPSPPSGQTP
jgi:exodeoxyribonuclease VII small subunit